MAIKWEWLDTQTLKTSDRLMYVYRAKVPGGWWVMITMQGTRFHMNAFFYPDPEHVWDGSTL